MMDRPLSILSVAYPLFPVHSDSAGGAEQILFLLDRALVESGHKSLVVAAQGSQIAGTLIATPTVSGEITEEIQSAAREAHGNAIQRALSENVDLIHFHSLDFFAYLPSRQVPIVATLHLPFDWYPAEITRLPVHLVSPSRAQARSIPKAENIPVIENGVDTDLFAPAVYRQDYLLWLGRICPEKGTEIALRVARQLDTRLIVAGPVHKFNYHQTYFAEQVRPLLDAKRVCVGPVGLDQKRKLLSEARCLLIPSSAPETSSLVAMEALASGTPVIAFRSGALPEVIEDNLTGFIVDSEAEMRDAVEKLPTISREKCVQAARERFHYSTMFTKYLQLYRKMIRVTASDE